MGVDVQLLYGVINRCIMQGNGEVVVDSGRSAATTSLLCCLVF